MDNIDKAIALARLRIKVFPVDSKTRRPLIAKGPDSEGGFYDATCDDIEQIWTWFNGQFPEDTTEVAVWAGGSDLIAVDLDRGKPNGKDGFKSLAEAHLEVSETVHYPTQSGGEHHIWRTDRLDLAPGADVLGMNGVDIRAGGSYFVWWGDDVPESRDDFSDAVPEWVIRASTASATDFNGEGFSGSVSDWLGSVSQDVLPSGPVREMMERIPKEDFAHPEMIELAWEAVRLGSERETGVKGAIVALRQEWLRDPYNTDEYRRDFDMALRGAINKAGRIQKPAPVVSGTNKAFRLAWAKAEMAGADTDLKRIQGSVSETGTEPDFARARREMFKIMAELDMTPAAALSVVIGTKAFTFSKASLESVWFGDGEPAFHDFMDEPDVKLNELAERFSEGPSNAFTKMSQTAESFTFLNPDELTRADGYDWWGRDYLAHVEGRLKHFNRPYHVSVMWAALSVIASPWGKVPLEGAKPTDCNLYFATLGESTSGKTESWDFGLAMIDAYYGTDESPVIGDINKLSPNALHQKLLLRDNKASLVYGDEIQSFFQMVNNSDWQKGILGDISGHYGGTVSPKLMLNDKENSSKRAKTMLTTYLTGIADQTLDAVSLGHWTNGFFYRYLWSFGRPRGTVDYSVIFDTAASTKAHDAQYEKWAGEFKRIHAAREFAIKLGAVVDWDESARLRMEAFKKQIDDEVNSEQLYEDVFVAANRRFAISVMKAATLVALSEGLDKVSLDHLLVAISFAGPWHKAMVLAVSETGKDPFRREVEKALRWIRKNAIRQLGKPPMIQRSSVMREFFPNEIAERILRQLTEEGWLLKAGDTYQLSAEE